MLSRFYKQDAGIRKQQINTLKIFNDNVVEVEEDSIYEVPFDSNKNKLVLKITLGPEFPKEKPVLTIQPVVVHHWVNHEGMITSAPGLLNFTVHSDLGRVVQAIIREFQRNPPALKGSTSRFLPPQGSQASFPQPHPANFTFPELKNLSLNELKFLNESEDCQIEFIEKQHSVKERNKELDELIQQIEDLIEVNLKKQEQLKEYKEIIDSKVEEVTKLAFENEKLYVIYQNLSEKYLPRNIQEELNKAAKKSDEETEKLAESFLQGEIDVEKFIASFIKTKAIGQKRKTKEEKLCYQLDRLEKAGF